MNFFILFSTMYVLLAKCEIQYLSVQRDSSFNMKIAYLVDRILNNSKYINLILENEQDYENQYVELILRNLSYPVYNIMHFTPCDSVEVDITYSQNQVFVIVADFKNINRCLENYVNAIGIYFFIFNSIGRIENINLFLTKAWETYESANVYIIAKDLIVRYDPFSYAVINVEKNENKYKENFRNLNGYPLRIEMFRSVYTNPVIDQFDKTKIITYKGADPNLANLLQEKMNFTFVHVETDKDYFGYRLENGTFTGAIGRLIARRSDIAMTGFFVKDYLTRGVEFTVAMYSDQLCCYVPKAERIPQSILPLFSLDFNMWMCFGFTAIASGTIWCCIRFINLYFLKIGVPIGPIQNRVVFSNSLHYLQIYVDALIVWVRLNLNDFPIVLSERLFVISVSLVSVIFGAVFESSLATVYIKPLYYKDINTLENLDHSGLKILLRYRAMMDDLFPNTTSAIFASLNKKMVLIAPTPGSLIEIMAKQGGFAGVTRASSMSLYDFKYFTSNKIYKVPECPKTYTLAYVLPDHSPFADRINQLLLRFLNAGLVEKFIKDMNYEARIKELNEPHIKVDDVYKILTLNDLQLAFYVMFIGSIVSGIFLILEIFYKRKCAKFTENKLL